jgi:hypothetical protein
MARVILPSAATAGARALPGAPRNLKTRDPGDGGVTLDWDEPLSGGQVESYRIYLHRDSPRKLIAETHSSQRWYRYSTVQGQQEPVSVTALNRVGEGEPSNEVQLQ